MRRHLYQENILLYKIQTHKDPEAFGSLYDLYINKIYRFVFFKVSNKEEAEDISSEVFLKAWNYLIDDERAKEIKSFNALIYGIARNAVIDFYRKKVHTREHSLEEAGNLIYEDTSLIRIESEQTKNIDCIFSAIKKMKQEYQEIILLKYVDELTTKEISEILNKKKTNIRVTLHRALKILRQLLNSENTEYKKD